jgi:uncharacterized protein (TIGR02611 family)
MFGALRQNWRDLLAGRPGKRFQERYQRRTEKRGGALRKGFLLTGGILVIAAGVILLPAPGPGLLVIAVGASMVAEESLTAARILDLAEVRVRRICAWAVHAWQAASRLQQAALAFGAVVLTGAFAFGIFELLMSIR